ncbi:hypothetical protein CK203_060165 [Vitis vinifera]|uniref:Retrotransposon gag domain-containing protein n=1 Tax=Vitis vinifera TaxID=29760 RepID=A0A438GMF1_VITVI|nr:hypothetical protein CK203_060165 [Vitis vinifera]
MAPLPRIEPGSNGAIATAAARTNQMAPLPGTEPRIKWRRCRGWCHFTVISPFQSTCDIHHNCACHIEYEIAEEAMNFMSYVAEFSREWDEPNARDMGRMTSQPKAKGEMYILNDGMNMKAEIAAMERRLEELEMKNMQEVQVISQTPLQAMPCAICLSYEHLVEECPIIPTEREMFGDCNTYNSNWRTIQISLGNHSHLSISNLLKHHSKPQSLNKLWLINLNTMQEKENSPSQPYQNSMSIHEMEVKEGESSMVKEIEEVITLKSGKEVDLPTCKLEHKVESETEKEKREEIKGKKKGKSIEKDGYDVNVQREPQRIVIKEELMKKHMPPLFLQALYGKILQSKSQARDANFIWDPGKLNQDQIF